MVTSSDTTQFVQTSLLGSARISSIEFLGDSLYYQLHETMFKNHNQPWFCYKCWSLHYQIFFLIKYDKLRGFSLRMNYTGQATATYRRTFVDKGCCVVSAMDPHGHIITFLDQSCYYYFQVAPRLYSRGWVDPVPDPLLLRKSGRPGNRTWDLWICSQELWLLDHRGGLIKY
jgi:hypothetical protein